METAGKFEFVSKKQFENDLEVILGYLPEYEITLPKRATAGSAGYDFALPFDLDLGPNDTIRIPSGIRSQIHDGWVLMIFPRSSLGFKYRLQLDNTVGIIDSDYYHADNEGHIIIKVTNHSDKTLSLKKGDRFVQGIFLPFGITEDDDATANRTGGFGSTNAKTFILTRQSNPTTGYQWEVINNTPEMISVKSRYLAPQNNGMTGVPGTEEFTFTALKSGRASVTILYKRPWEEISIDEDILLFDISEDLTITQVH
ncbi:MAG: protease inhibitor I42 family protein [Erysipelotrichaceae bacterium]|nr:protease inhibitor I42 family protein [Erysipelotrichaceae bacterium]